MPTPILVITSMSDRELARRISYQAVTGGLAAAAQIYPAESLYRWKGEVHETAEYTVVFKSLEERFDALRRMIREQHSYQLPQIIALRIDLGDRDYLAWIAEQAG